MLVITKLYNSLYNAVLLSSSGVNLKISNLLSKQIILVHFHPLGLTCSTEFLSFKTLKNERVSVINNLVFLTNQFTE